MARKTEELKKEYKEEKKLDPKIQDVIDFLESTKAFVPDHYKVNIDHKIKELKG